MLVLKMFLQQEQEQEQQEQNNTRTIAVHYYLISAWLFFKYN